MKVRVRLVPTVLFMAGMLLLVIEALVMNNLFKPTQSPLDFWTSFIALQLASFVATTSILNGWRLWRVGERSRAQDNFAAMLMWLGGLSLFVLVVAAIF